jgi:membrane-associated phospholipid phosphatase
MDIAERTRRRDQVLASVTRRSVATSVSEAFSPLLVDAVLLIAIAFHRAPSLVNALEWAFLAIGFVSVVPMLIIRYGVQRRRLSDRHVSIRQQRPLPIALAILSIAVGLATLVVIHAPRELLAVVVAMLVGLLISLIVTLVWKISLHTGTLAGAIVILVLALSPTFAGLFPLVVLVGGARVELGSHSPLQVSIGAALGVIVAGVVFSLLR